MENKFGKLSQLNLTASVRDGKTYLKDIFFTAPFKIMKPFEQEDGSIQVMQLMASAGILEGDRQNINIVAQEGSNLEFQSQSFEKIHRMKQGDAKRSTYIKVEKAAAVCYHPLPVIPFAGSAFENKIRIELEEETALFFMCEILSGGRIASDELFAWKYYHNFIEIYKAGRLIYFDNTRYENDPEGIMGFGMFEGFTHLASLIMCNIVIDEEKLAYINNLLKDQENVEGGDYQNGMWRCCSSCVGEWCMQTTGNL